MTIERLFSAPVAWELLVPGSHALKLSPRMFTSLMQERRKMDMTDEAFDAEYL